MRARIEPEELQPVEQVAHWRSDARNDAFFAYVRCASCGLLYNDRYLSPESLSAAYALMPDNTAGQPHRLLLRTHQRYLEELAGLGRLGGHYLEVGADIGLTAGLALQSGTWESADLVEPNRASHDNLRSVTDRCRVEVVESIRDLRPEVHFDHLVLVHVLDHLPEPKVALEALRSRLASGATVLVVVHDEASMLRRLLGRRWPPFRLQHPQLFSPASLRRLLETTGFAVERIRGTSNTMSIRHLVRNTLDVLGLPPGWSDRFPEFGISLRLGNIAAVARVS